jgi:hypothetical protein
MLVLAYAVLTFVSQDALGCVINAAVEYNFGFHVTTFNGHVPLRNEWCDSWEACIEWEQTVRGADPDFNKVAEVCFEKVIPRLLRPLQFHGRTIWRSLARICAT